MPFNVFSYLTILQFIESLNIKIPRFCYHERLSVAGNCRMCLVEIQSSLKPVISCATKLISGMKILTTNNLIDNLRETILEFLLVNHPLDCPICDQGSECDLQDQVLSFGNEKSRFIVYNWVNNKRSLFDKLFDNVIKTLMTRCIQCSRCIRYIDEYLFSFKFGLMGRGSPMEISNYSDIILDVEYTSNLIELCPVGAITSKKSAYRKRNWELDSYETIDVFDSLCSNLRLDIKGNKIVRILPKLNEILNEDWISNKVRKSIEVVINMDVYSPSYYFSNFNINCSFSKSYFLLSLILFNFRNLKYYFVNSLSHFFLNSKFDFLSSLSLLFFSSFVNSNYIINDYLYNLDNRVNFLINKKLNHFFNSSNFLFYNINLVEESPFINLKIKKKIINKKSNHKLEYVGKNIISHINLVHKCVNLKNIKKIIKGKWFKYNNNHFNFVEGSQSYLFNFLINGLNNQVNKNISYSSLKNQSSYLHLFETGISNCFFNSSFNIIKFSKLNLIFYYNELFKKIKYFNFNINFTEKIDLFFSNLYLPISSFYKSSDLYYNIEGSPQYSNKLLNSTSNTYTISLFLLNFFLYFSLKFQYLFYKMEKMFVDINNLIYVYFFFNFNSFFYHFFSKYYVSFINKWSLKFSKLNNKFRIFSIFYLKNINNYFYNNSSKKVLINNYKFDLNILNYVL